MATQEGLEKLLVEFNDNTLSAKDFLRRAATTANCSEPVVIDEILTFTYSKASPIVVKSYDKDVEQPRDLCEIRKFMVLSKPEFEILNEGNGIECYVRCCNMGNEDEEFIPLHFYGAIAKRVSKGRLEEFLAIEEKMRNNPNMSKVVKDSRRSSVRWVISRRMIVRGRIFGGVFFVFDFQDWIGDDVQWDVEKRYFHREDSYAFQIALDNVSREFRNKTEKAFLLLEDEVVARMKSVSNAYLETNDT